MTKNRFKIVCQSCQQQIGYVEEVEVRPGFFMNKTTPDVLPQRCPCLGVLTRIKEG